MKKIKLSLLLGLYTLVSGAQDRPIIKINSVISYPMQEQFAGKPVILDLFNSNCATCFKMLPKVNELQQKYFGKMDFLLVGDEDCRIRNLYSKFEKRLGLHLRVAFDSTFFRRHRIDFVPRYVWIHTDGKVAAVTGPASITAENIERFLAGQFQENVYEDKPMPYNYFKPFALSGNGAPDTAFLFRSILGIADKRTPFSQPVILNYVKGTGTFNTLNVTANDLYMYAYLGKTYWMFKDSMYGKYFTKPIYIDDTMARDSVKYFYSFTTSLANPGRDMLERALRNDLQSYFGYQAFVTHMNCPYWSVVVDPSRRDSLKTKGARPSFQSDYSGIKATNVPLKNILSAIDYARVEGLQYVDDSGLPFNIDLHMEANFLDPVDFISAFARAGIRFVKAEKDMIVLMLKKNPAAVAAK